MTIQGQALLEIIQQNPGKSAKQLAEITGYIAVNKVGRQRVRIVAFQNAVLQANHISFEDAPEKSTYGMQRGRKATSRIQVQKNGSLLISAANIRQLKLAPGTKFEVHLGRKHIELVPLERAFSV